MKHTYATKNEILNYLKEHKNEFEKKFGISKIGLFGSFARDEATNSSDIDILVEIKNDTIDIHEKKLQLKELIEKAFNKKVDIAREKYLKKFVKDEILKEVCYV